MPATEPFVNVVIKLLKENPRGLNITDIEDKTGYSRFAVPHYMQALVDLGYVDLVEKGKMKTYYYKENPHRQV